MDEETLPQSLQWTLERPITHGGVTVETITLRAPTVGEVMKATAVQGRSNMEVALWMINAVSGIDYGALQQLPEYIVGQMVSYMEEFARVPAPSPLERYREARRKRVEEMDRLSANASTGEAAAT